MKSDGTMEERGVSATSVMAGLLISYSELPSPAWARLVSRALGRGQRWGCRMRADRAIGHVEYPATARDGVPSPGRPKVDPGRIVRDTTMRRPGHASLPRGWAIRHVQAG